MVTILIRIKAGCTGREIIITTMAARFPPSVKNDIRQKFNWTCTICRCVVPVEGSHCAHLFDASAAGADQVGCVLSTGSCGLTADLQITDATSLGLLSAAEPYKRDTMMNSILRLFSMSDREV
jgi:hypothetical protein